MLETIWFLLWGILWAIYFVLDGFDLGLGTLMPFLAHEEVDKRIVYRAMGPFWDGNEVWLITAGGVTFAAFPAAYAVMFSALYSALMLLLFALILRAVAFEFRDKVESASWRRLWDLCLFVGSFLPALLLGVAFGNLFKGIPIDADGVYHGTLFTLLNPYGLAGGLLFVSLFLQHGALWLAARTGGALQERAARAAGRLWGVVLVMIVLFLTLTAVYTRLYSNYLKMPVLFILPALAVLGLLMTRVQIRRQEWWKAWGASGLLIFATTLFGVVGLYPCLIPSTLDPAYSMTAFNSASSPLTLKIMLGVALVFVPLVIIYQAWTYRLFSHKVTPEEAAYDEGY